MVSVQYAKGIHLPTVDLWLDPRGRKSFAFVSHAHSDHTGRHQHIFCSPLTARLSGVRDRLDSARFLTADFGKTVNFERWSGTLIPAGHVLGSAQLFFESEEGSLLYTGDFKRHQGLSSEAAGACHAETLIMETTYGLPKYQFPPVEESRRQLLAFCHDTVGEGRVPVLLGYSLGKAQEILAAIAGCGFPIMTHPAITKMVAIYTGAGIPMPDCAEWDPENITGHVVVCPPHATKALGALKNCRMATVTGWALDAGTRYRMGVDVAIPLSDHADYAGLLAHVQDVSPKRVLTLHGYAQEFARDLRRLGIEAWALTGPNQMELSI
ncbi:MAG: MBL fold metallo-hydrolase [Terrimicrobiaceae bacterium]